MNQDNMESEQAQNIVGNNIKIGYIGLGKMGLNMVKRLRDQKYEVVVLDHNEPKIAEAVQLGCVGSTSVKDLFEKLRSNNNEKQIVIWLMIPHQSIEKTLEEIEPELEPEDILIDGGNSFYQDSINRYAKLKNQNLNFLDAGVSGGPSGALNGACIMVGGDKEIYMKVEKLFKDLTLADGCQYVGSAGSGHYAKMVHNGIEYGMMASIGEGFNLLKESRYHFDLKKMAKLYSHGSVIESRLMSLLSNGYDKYDQDLHQVTDVVGHTGEVEWLLKDARKNKIPVSNIKQSYKIRLNKKNKTSYIRRVLSLLRNQFGGHSL